MMALQMDVATLPPPADVNMIPILIVVGKQVKINKPSTNAGGMRVGKKVEIVHFKGSPTKRGQAPKMIS